MDVEERTPVEQSLTHPKYRPDIDGLRAIAVLSVVSYHAFPQWMPGGFVGVDIFFVISGFLISTVLLKSISSGEFRFGEFYSRRVRRIFPALAAVLLTTLVAGWFFLLPDEYRQLGKHVLGGVGFLSNIVLWRESGYFDVAAEMKPLLHLWSLGIEEQFYVVFPLFVWLMRKGRSDILMLVTVIGMSSFLLNIMYVHVDPIWTFYLPQTRCWELMVGSLLSFLVLDGSGRGGRFEAFLDSHLKRVIHHWSGLPPPGTTWANCKAWLGILLLTVAFYCINRNSPFPGSWAAVPTMGAALLIWAGPWAFVNRWFLSSSVLVWIGKISYPFYLWHWVILSYLHIQARGTPSSVTRAEGVVVAIVVSWLTYRLIEQPLRLGSRGRKKTFALVATMMMIGVLGFMTVRTDGFTALRLNRVEAANPEKIAALQAVKGLALKDLAESNRCFQLPPDKDFDFFLRNQCTEPANKSETLRTVLLVGDSHSASLALGVKPWTEAHGIDFHEISSGSCSLFSDDASDAKCQEYTRKTFAVIQATKPDVLLVDSHWLHASEPVYFKNLGHWLSYTDYIMDRFRLIASLGAKRVIIIGQVPTWTTDLPNILMWQLMSRGQDLPERSRADLDLLSLTMDARMRKLGYPKYFKYFSLSDLFCDPTGCLTRVGPELDKDLVVWDYGHLTGAGAKFVMDRGLSDVILETLGEVPKN